MKHFSQRIVAFENNKIYKAFSCHFIYTSKKISSNKRSKNYKVIAFFANKTPDPKNR